MYLLRWCWMWICQGIAAIFGGGAAIIFCWMMYSLFTLQIGAFFLGWFCLIACCAYAHHLHMVAENIRGRLRLHTTAQPICART